jgi:hypothetical protein
MALAVALNRANSAYLCLIAVFLIGIWIILDLGSAYVTAPRDLSGSWRLVKPSGPQPAAGFSVAQSGRYLRFAVDGGPTIDAIMQKSTADEGTTMSFRGGGWRITGSGPSVGQNLDFTFTPPRGIANGPPSGTYQRQRTGPDTVASVQSSPQRPPSSPPNAALPSAAPPNAGH